MSGHTLNSSLTDSDTVSTSELLDLIQADVAGTGRPSRNTTRRASALSRGGASSGGSSGRGSGGSNSGASTGRGSGATTQSSMNSDRLRELNGGRDPFSVRLTPQQSSRRRVTPFSAPSGDGPPLFGNSDDDDDDDDGSEDDDSVGDMSGFDSYKYGRSERAKMKRRSGKKKKANVPKKQRMPLGGGYGGMFDSHDSDASSAVSSDGSMSSIGASVDSSNGTGTGPGGGTRDDSSATTSVFSLASRLFRKRHNRHGGSKNSNPYHGSSMQHSLTSRTIASNMHFNGTMLGKATTCYLALPFRLRYFVQLFSIMGVFMIASLNYFIAMETKNQRLHVNSPGMQQQQHKQYNSHFTHQHSRPWIAEGGGASSDQIPRLRVRDPMKFLHQDMKPNELLEKAMAKFKGSTRFGFDDPTMGIAGMKFSGGGKDGPFKYGWKSMPRQIYNDFASGLSDDSKTIEHAKNSQHYQNMAQRQVGFSEHGDNEETTAATIMEAAELSNSKWGTRRPPKGTVAYVLAVTTCYGEDAHPDVYPTSPNQPKNEEAFRDFALMLRAMVHAHSYKNAASGSVYDYKMHAIVHPRAKKCKSHTEDSLPSSAGMDEGMVEDGIETYNTDGVVDRSLELQNLGYSVEVKYSPLSQVSLQGESYIKEYMAKTGVTQIVDLMRLYAYELDEYDAVVLVDYDTLILGPIDKAVDLIVDSKSSTEDGQDVGGDGGDGNSAGNINNNSIDAVFSWEHLPSLVTPQARASVINLSFFLLRPSKSTFEKLVQRYQNAPFSETRGWGTIGRGQFGGWMTTVGFLTYYYDEVANANKIELNRCAFGNTGQDYNEDSSILITNGGTVECGGDTGDGAESNNMCDECSKSKLKGVSVADLSYCRAPWECGGGDTNNDAADTDSSATIDTLSSGLCRKFQKMWFSGRLQMEDVHPQLQKGSGKLCVDGQYQPIMLLKPSAA